MCAETPEDLRALYRELILDHAKEPRHYGTVDSPTHEAKGINRLCGDRLELTLRVGNEQIEDVRFEGTGCAIAIASASLLTETVSGSPLDEALRFSENLIERLTAPDASDSGFDPGELRALEGVREYPSRVKCATLPWQTLKSAIEGSEAPASTE